MMSQGFHQNIDRVCICQPHREWLSSWPDWLASARIVIRVIPMWVERSRQRRALLDLDDDQFRDIGISRKEAREEAAKPFWL